MKSEQSGIVIGAVGPVEEDVISAGAEQRIAGTEVVVMESSGETAIRQFRAERLHLWQKRLRALPVLLAQPTWTPNEQRLTIRHDLLVELWYPRQPTVGNAERDQPVRLASRLDLHLRELRQQPLPVNNPVFATHEVAHDLPTMRGQQPATRRVNRNHRRQVRWPSSRQRTRSAAPRRRTTARRP